MRQCVYVMLRLLHTCCSGDPKRRAFQRREPLHPLDGVSRFAFASRFLWVGSACGRVRGRLGIYDYGEALVAVQVEDVEPAERCEPLDSLDGVLAEHEHAERRHALQPADARDLVVVEVQEDERGQSVQVVNARDGLQGANGEFRVRALSGGWLWGPTCGCSYLALQPTQPGALFC